MCFDPMPAILARACEEIKKDRDRLLREVARLKAELADRANVR